MPAMFETLLEERERRPSDLEKFFSTHPLTEGRIQRARELIAELSVAEQGLQTKSPRFREFQKQLASLPPPPDATR